MHVHISAPFALLFPLVPVVLFLGLGIFAIVFGCYLRYHPGRFWRGESWKQLLKWQVVTPATAHPLLLEEFVRSRDFILSSAIIGVGLALVLVLSSGVILALSIAGIATGTLLVEILRQFLGPAVYLSYLLGYGLGTVYGVWRLRRLTARGATYGDLQPRTLADYRSAVFPWSAALLIVGVVLITLLMEPHLGPEVPLDLAAMSTDMTQSAAPVWLLWALPAVMLLTLIMGEVLLGQIARLPRLVITSQPSAAQRADNLLRALTIGTIQGLELQAIGCVGTVHAMLMSASLWHSGFWQLDTQRPLNPLTDTGYWFAVIVLVFGILLPACAGRIGGRIAGWPWRPAQIP